MYANTVAYLLPVLSSRASAESNSKKLQQDIIICSMGVSYRGYCANMARTILVDPPKKVQGAYKALTEAFEACVDAMRPGEPLKAVHEACRAYLEKKHPEYLQYLPKTFGSSIGKSWSTGPLFTQFLPALPTSHLYARQAPNSGTRHFCSIARPPRHSNRVCTSILWWGFKTYP